MFMDNIIHIQMAINENCKKLIEAFPTGTDEETIFDVMLRFGRLIKTGIKCDNIQEYPAIYTVDRTSCNIDGPLTVEQMKQIMLTKRKEFPKMKDRESEIIKDLDKYKQEQVCKTIITFDYVHDDILMWYTITSPLFPQAFNIRGAK